MSPERSFVHVGQAIAVDFVNTELIEAGGRLELLQSDADVVRWARSSNLQIAPGVRGESTCLNSQVLLLRKALRGLFQASIDGSRASRADLAALNQRLCQPRSGAAVRLLRNQFDRHSPRLMSVDDILRAVAEDAAALLCGPDRSRLRRCDSQRCILMFIDLSKRRGRRWCSMEVCGNRAKVAAHYRRVIDAD